MARGENFTSDAVEGASYPEVKTDLEAKLDTKVGEALGFVSLCWEPKPEGVFDSVSATAQLSELLTWIHANFKQRSE